MAEFAQVLKKLMAGEDLGLEEADAAMEAIIRQEWQPAQIGAFLVALRQKGERALEIAGFADAMRRAAIPIEAPPDAVDLCGTGGDGSGTFNISTAASLLAAACGVTVVKHGNRAVSSRSGSADVLEALGIPTDLGPEAARQALDRFGFCFLFAPRYHPAMAAVASVRRDLGIRTVFNCLGPLLNPAAPRYQVIGVYEPGLQRTVAEVLGQQGARRAFVVHGAGGLDELSTYGPTRIVELAPSGALLERWITLADLGLEQAPEGSLKGGSAEENATLLEAILTGEEEGPRRDAAVANAALGLWLLSRVDSLAAGVAEVDRVIGEGKAGEWLERLRTGS